MLVVLPEIVFGWLLSRRAEPFPFSALRIRP
jgi:hypothetical protein